MIKIRWEFVTLFIGFIFNVLSAQTLPSGKIKGKIIDHLGNPLEYASITATHQKDSSFTGILSDEKGFFNLEVPKPGKYKVFIKFLGFETKVIEGVMVVPPTFEADLGKIELISMEVKQDTVIITSDKSLFEVGIDKKVFNVSKTPLAEGGNAINILQTIPSVTVDTENNIQLRGSENVMILIDGKPSSLSNNGRTLLLEQIPANMIERIEVITNPSAKYDPEGVSGIINIITKKNEMQLWFATATVTFATNSKYNGGFLFSVRRKKWTYGFHYNYQENLYWTNGFLNRNNIFSDTSFYLRQTSHGSNWSRNHSLRFNLDYNLSQNSSMYFSANVQNRLKNSYDYILYRFLNEMEQLEIYSHRYNVNQKAGGYNGDLAWSYKKNFHEVFHTLSIDAQYSYNQSVDPNQFSQFFWTNQNVSLNERTLLQKNDEQIKNRVGVFQVDYVRPIKKLKLEAGIKSTLRKVDGNLLASLQDTLGIWINDPRYSNHGYLDERIHAVYGQISGKNAHWGFLTGFRAEHTYLNVVQLTLNRTDKNPYFSIFPSIHISKYFKENQEFKLSYSKRINRPGLESLNPFINFQDPFNLRFGNPKLKPEFTHSVELSYQRPINKLLFTSSVYYRYTYNKITRFRAVSNEGIATITFLNLNQAQDYGLEFILKGSPVKWWNGMISFNGYQTFINGNNVENSLSNSGFSWNTRFLSTLTPIKNWEFQFSYNYNAPMITILGEMLPVHGLDIAAKTDLLRKKLSLSLRVSDVLDTRRFGVRIYNSNITQTFVRKRETRIAFITATWKFGSEKAQLQPKKRREEQQLDRDNDPGM